MDEAKWLGGQCNCPAFFKKFMCKRVVGLAMRSNYCKLPPAAKNIKVAEKRRRGRRWKAIKKHCLFSKILLLVIVLFFTDINWKVTDQN